MRLRVITLAAIGACVLAIGAAPSVAGVDLNLQCCAEKAHRTVADLCRPSLTSPSPATSGLSLPIGTAHFVPGDPSKPWLSPQKFAALVDGSCGGDLENEYAIASAAALRYVTDIPALRAGLVGRTGSAYAAWLGLCKGSSRSERGDWRSDGGAARAETGRLGWSGQQGRAAEASASTQLVGSQVSRDERVAGSPIGRKPWDRSSLLADDGLGGGLARCLPLAASGFLRPRTQSLSKEPGSLQVGPTLGAPLPVPLDHQQFNDLYRMRR